MNTLTNHGAGQSSPAKIKGAATRVSITLALRNDDRLCPVAVECADNGTVTKSAFAGCGDLGDVLCLQLCQEIKDLLGNSWGNVGVRSFPEYQLILPGLSLNRARVVTTKSRDGKTFVVVRFAECLGNVVSIFSRSARPWQMGHDQTAAIAAQTLETIVVPLKNFSQHMETGAHDRPENTAALQRARDQIQDMELYYNMLIDFVGATRDPQIRRTVSAVEMLSQIS